MTEHDVHEDPRAEADAAIAHLAAGISQLVRLLGSGEFGPVKRREGDLCAAQIMIGSLLSHLKIINVDAA